MLQNNRWAIFLDIEGFSHFKTDNEFYRSVETILSTIYLIGSKVYNESPERLFVHHIGGDGFLIVSDFAEKDLSRPIAITTILMRSLVLNGFVGKAGISVGDFADISGCWPRFSKLVENDLPKLKCDFGEYVDPAFNDRTRISIGEGLLFPISVMGKALINSYKTQASGQKGPNLIVDSSLKEMIPKDFPIITESESQVIIDWLHIENEELNKIASGINDESLLDLEQVSKNLDYYIQHKSEGVSEEWLENAKAFLK